MARILRACRTGLLLPGRLYGAAGLTVDWTHPLAQGLVTFCLPDGQGGLVDLAKPRGCSGGTASFGSRGPATKNLATIANASAPDANFTTAPFSGACVFYLTSTTTSDWIWGMTSYTSESVNSGWVIQAFSPSVIAVNLFNNNASASYRQTATATTAVGDMSCGFSNDGTNRKIFVNGKLDSTATGLTTTCASTTAGLGVDFFNAGVTELYVGAAWARVVTDEEMALFHFDPFCLLVPAEPEFMAAQAIVASGGLFLPPHLNGLGAGGPFFRNPVG